MAAVCSQWSHSVGDSFKDDAGDFVIYNTLFRDAYFGMSIFVDKTTGSAEVTYLTMTDSDINDVANSFALKNASEEECDERWNELVDSVNNDLSSGAEYCTSSVVIREHSTRKEVEKILDSCLKQALKVETDLERSFYEKCEENNEFEESLNRRITRLERLLRSESCKKKTTKFVRKNK